jgi:hypothetical protein
MNEIKLKFRIENDETIPAFAGFIKDSANNGEAIFHVNMNATLFCCAEHDIDFYEFLAENTVHELLHAFQELYKRAFNEDEIEQALLQARELIEKEKLNNPIT